MVRSDHISASSWEWRGAPELLETLLALGSCFGEMISPHPPTMLSYWLGAAEGL